LLVQASEALAGDDPEQALAGVRAALAKLELAGEPPSEATRTIADGLLRCALFRVAERDELKRVRERMQMLSSASFEGILVHVDGVVVDANQRVSEITGYDQSQLLGAGTIKNCLAPEDTPEVSRRIAERFEGTYVVNAIHRDGTRFRAELQSKQGRLGDRPVRVVAVRDVTERERTLALLHESEQRLRDHGPWSRARRLPGHRRGPRRRDPRRERAQPG